MASRCHGRGAAFPWTRDEDVSRVVGAKWSNRQALHAANDPVDPWGALLAGDSTNGYSFTGREFDLETGLHFFRSRYADTVRGRFLSEDSAGFSADTNWYRYVASRPTAWTDPFGHDVVVSFYRGGPTNPFGHVGIAVNQTVTKGFYPRDGGSPWAPVSGTPGELRTDDPSKHLDSFVIPTTAAQDKAVQAALDKVARDPGNYSLFNQNCAKTVQDVLTEGGILLPKRARTIAPEKFYNDLKRFYAPQK